MAAQAHRVRACATDPPGHRQVDDTLETKAARQASLDCRLDDIRSEESEGQGHPDRALGLALWRSHRLRSPPRIRQKFVEPAMGIAKSFDQDRARWRASGRAWICELFAPWMIS